MEATVRLLLKDYKKLEEAQKALNNLSGKDGVLVIDHSGRGCWRIYETEYSFKSPNEIQEILLESISRLKKEIEDTKQKCLDMSVVEFKRCKKLGRI